MSSPRRGWGDASGGSSPRRGPPMSATASRWLRARCWSPPRLTTPAWWRWRRCSTVPRGWCSACMRALWPTGSTAARSSWSPTSYAPWSSPCCAASSPLGTSPRGGRPGGRLRARGGGGLCLSSTTSTLTPMLVDQPNLGIANARLSAGFITTDQLVGPPSEHSCSEPGWLGRSSPNWCRCSWGSSWWPGSGPRATRW